MSALKTIIRAESVIQRDSLLAAFHEAGIEALSPPRDVSRKLTDSMVDYAYGGYSAIFDGFAIQVPEEQWEEARQIVDQVLKQARSFDEVPHEASNSLKKFYFCCFFVLLAPLVMNIVAFYHLYKAYQHNEKLARWSVLLGVLWLVLSGSLLLGALGDSFLRPLRPF
jgi:hypothetical protein